jgi:hypothetical protein
MRFTLVASALVFSLTLGSASAGTIKLRGGSIDYQALATAFGPVHFEGNRGFTFDGSTQGGLLQVCFLLICIPGETGDIHAAAFGIDVLGTATLQGVTYDVPAVSGPESMAFEITGEFIVPPVGPSATVTLVVPVNFSGTFIHSPKKPSPITDHTTENLIANAIATVTLTQGEVGPGGTLAWSCTDLTIDIVKH